MQILPKYIQLYPDNQKTSIRYIQSDNAFAEIERTGQHILQIEKFVGNDILHSLLYNVNKCSCTDCIFNIQKQSKVGEYRQNMSFWVRYNDENANIY